MAFGPISELNEKWPRQRNKFSPPLNSCDFIGHQGVTQYCTIDRFKGLKIWNYEDIQELTYFPCIYNNAMFISNTYKPRNTKLWRNKKNDTALIFVEDSLLPRFDFLKK